MPAGFPGIPGIPGIPGMKLNEEPNGRKSIAAWLRRHTSAIESQLSAESRRLRLPSLAHPVTDNYELDAAHSILHAVTRT
jgi:hypothetical protein